MTTATRTFDCPWCGAITPVPSDHLGEHLKCSECGQSTKLTSHNTSSRRPTETPPDAPHLSGDRTFDCPWCGAISDVPSSHIGERFACPECKKDTKLTATNTQRAGVTAPPPEAPHVEGGPRPGLWIGIGVVTACVLAYFGLRTPGTEEAPGAGGKAPAPMSAQVEPAPLAPTATTPGVNPAPGVEPAVPPPASVPPAAPEEDPARTRALAAIAGATSRLGTASEAHAKAYAAVVEWTTAHAGSLEALAALPALEQVTAQVDAFRVDTKLFPGPEQPTPDQVRAFNAAMGLYLGATPERVQVAEKALAFLRGDLHGREVAGITSWQGIHFYGPGFQRAVSTLLGSAKVVAAPVPEALTRARPTPGRRGTRPEAALDAANAALAKIGPGPAPVK